MGGGGKGVEGGGRGYTCPRRDGVRRGGGGVRLVHNTSVLRTFDSHLHSFGADGDSAVDSEVLLRSWLKSKVGMNHSLGSFQETAVDGVY